MDGGQSTDAEGMPQPSRLVRLDGTDDGSRVEAVPDRGSVSQVRLLYEREGSLPVFFRGWVSPRLDELAHEERANEDRLELALIAEAAEQLRFTIDRDGEPQEGVRDQDRQPVIAQRQAVVSRSREPDLATFAPGEVVISW